MELEPITRQEQIIAGKDLEPITRMEKFLKQYGGGGGGFEYDFIIKSTNGETFTLETGTYESINAKLGNQPLNGKIILTDGQGYIADMNCVLVANDGNSLKVYGFGEDGVMLPLTINADNTVTL